MTDTKKTSLKNRLSVLGKRAKTLAKIGAVAATLVAGGKVQAAGSPMRRGSIQQAQPEYHESSAVVYEQSQPEYHQEPVYDQSQVQYDRGMARGRFTTPKQSMFGRGSRVRAPQIGNRGIYGMPSIGGRGGRGGIPSIGGHGGRRGMNSIGGRVRMPSGGIRGIGPRGGGRATNRSIRGGGRSMRGPGRRGRGF